jgi:hypothetical protein
MTCDSPHCNCKQFDTIDPEDRVHRAQRQKRADREWEMAGLARQDGDKKAELEHTERARRIQRGEE